MFRYQAFQICVIPGRCANESHIMCEHVYLYGLLFVYDILFFHLYSSTFFLYSFRYSLYICLILPLSPLISLSLRCRGFMSVALTTISKSEWNKNDMVKWMHIDCKLNEIHYEKWNSVAVHIHSYYHIRQFIFNCLSVRLFLIFMHQIDTFRLLSLMRPF